jgi:hypothetical protein
MILMTDKVGLKQAKRVTRRQGATRSYGETM